jgi:hypothetical protein
MGIKVSVSLVRQKFRNNAEQIRPHQSNVLNVERLGHIRNSCPTSVQGMDSPTHVRFVRRNMMLNGLKDIILITRKNLLGGTGTTQKLPK